MLYIILGIAVLLALLAAVIAHRPDYFCITRSLAIRAEASDVFAYINDFHLWGQWSPWEKMDANLQREYSGSAQWVGAMYAWKGKKAGEGKMVITESIPSIRIAITLDFIRPMKATNFTEFTLEQQDDLVVVTWAMSGKNAFISKAFGLVVNVDRMVGGDFEKGLVALKGVCESTSL